MLPEGRRRYAARAKEGLTRDQAIERIMPYLLDQIAEQTA